MTLFAPYRIGARTYRAYYRKTQLIGLVPVSLAVLLALSMRRMPGPGLWCALGVALGLHMVLGGAHHLHSEKARRTRLGDRLVAATDRWFPPFLFIVRHIFEIMVLLMLWISLTDLGFPASPLLHGLFIVLLVLWPVKGLYREMVRTSNLVTHHIADECVHYVMIVTATLLIATSVTSFIAPARLPITPEMTPRLVLVWVPAILIILSCVFLFADHRRRYGREIPAPAQPAKDTHF